MSTVMKVRSGTYELDLKSDEAPARDCYRREVGSPHGAICRHHEVRCETILKPCGKRFKARAPRLFLAFDDHLQIDRETSPALT